ncbi:MAG: tolB protein [Acidobacteriaceae bacterium]|nr:tolB protein [Acidobacteriaceae bacterium]
MRKCSLAAALAIFLVHLCNAQSLGIFAGHSDVGTVVHAGSTGYDSSKNAYTLVGSGENMWSTADAFQFAWKKVSGDVEISADISFLNSGGNEHKKAVLMIRQSLDPDSVYADVALHGNGLTSLQYRDEKGGTTHEVESTISAPRRLRITRAGKYVYISLAQQGSDLHFAAGSVRIPLDGEFYAGIGVCSHDKNATEQATFANVEIKNVSSGAAQPVAYSSLETVTIATTIRHVVYLAPNRFEASNWAHDGSYLLFNRNGHLEKLAVGGGAPEVINSGFADKLNNDHGISPDSTQLAVSDNSQETKSATGAASHDSLVYILPIAGGTPRRLTQNAPSYGHGWSPDGRTLAFVGQRNGDFDIYTIPASGGAETRLTTAKGLDDGPEYSPDGQYIYFNSERTGHMQIWRMHSDGTGQEQIFSDDYNNWFPHISPDGKWMVFLTYERDVTGHPENKDVMLRLMSLDDKKILVLTKLFGGQGSINVPSWSPDSKSVAFVSYQLVGTE